MKLWFLENSWRGILELLDFTRKGVNQELYGMSLAVNWLVWVAFYSKFPMSALVDRWIQLNLMMENSWVLYTTWKVIVSCLKHFSYVYPCSHLSLTLARVLTTPRSLTDASPRLPRCLMLLDFGKLVCVSLAPSLNSKLPQHFDVNK